MSEWRRHSLLLWWRGERRKICKAFTPLSHHTLIRPSNLSHVWKFLQSNGCDDGVLLWDEKNQISITSTTHKCDILACKKASSHRKFIFMLSCRTLWQLQLLTEAPFCEKACHALLVYGSSDFFVNLLLLSNRNSEKKIFTHKSLSFQFAPSSIIRYIPWVFLDFIFAYTHYTHSLLRSL